MRDSGTLLRKDVLLPRDCLAATAERLELALPPTLAPTPTWRDDGTAAARWRHVLDALDQHGLRDGDHPSEDFTGTVRLLCAAATELFAYVDQPDLRYRLHVAADHRDAVLACLVPASGNVLLHPTRPDALAETLLAELPDWPQARGTSLSAPLRDIRDADPDGPLPRGDAGRVLDLLARPRHAAGQVSAGRRGGLDHRRTTTHPLTFVDLDTGRWLVHVTADRDSEPHVVAVPAGWDLLLTKTRELGDTPRRR
ncbi:EspG family protein [Amycolatopsis arida]|uniref:EspG family protein n=1 Tax=Amycolatopsis arida TaxID=587909 RepID=A0A1I5Z2Y1_9PSEU|nr:ESX secretion-associated protein EspG [Amycolatopsis arida]TDX90084.1 ESAT-6 protein secretion system EspG family protein [Amycolatopsis arida]SFQ50811.1 EspG family protein [Amycolatopsis arida]